MMALVWKQLVKHRVKFKFFSRNSLDYSIIIFNSPLGYINKSLNPQIMERESVSNQMQSALELLDQNLLSLNHELQPELSEGNNFPFCPDVGMTVCLWFYAFESRFGGGHLVSENPFFFPFFFWICYKRISVPLLLQQNVKEGQEKMLVAASQKVQTLLLQLENLHI